MLQLDLSMLQSCTGRNDKKAEAHSIDLQYEHPTAFAVAPVRDVTAFEHEVVSMVKPSHGTTTLGFVFDKGVMIAVDSRSTMGSYINSQEVNKVLVISERMVGTMAGGAADCAYWQRYLGMRCRLFELANAKKISVCAASKVLASILFQYRGRGLSVGTMIAGYDHTGPGLYYCDNDGHRTKGKIFSVGSGSLYAYGVLDDGFKEDLSVEDAAALARRAIYHATYKDASSGGAVSVYYISENGWQKLSGDDVSELHFKYYPEPGRHGTNGEVL